MRERIEITLQLTPAEAWALAELVKRIGWSELRPLAANIDEAHQMVNAVDTLRSALALAGVAPR